MTYTTEEAAAVLAYCLKTGTPLPGTPEKWEQIMEEIKHEHD